jgi:hypothetical protein
VRTEPHRASRRAREAAEQWEFPVRRDLERHDWVFSESRAHRADGLAEEAVSGLPYGRLLDLAGRPPAAATLVLPPRCRVPQDGGFRRVRLCAPRQVLVLGSRAVVHWVDMFGIRAVVPAEDVIAIEDAPAGHYRRLELRTPTGHVVVRYDAPDRAAVFGFATDLRSAIAGPPLPVPTTPALPPGEAARWADALDGPHGRLTATTGRLIGRRVLVGLTPTELIVARTAGRGPALPRHNALYVPRNRLRDLSVHGAKLRLHTGDAGFRVTVGRRQTRWLRDALGHVRPGEPTERPPPERRLDPRSPASASRTSRRRDVEQRRPFHVLSWAVSCRGRRSPRPSAGTVGAAPCLSSKSRTPRRQALRRPPRRPRGRPPSPRPSTATRTRSSHRAAPSRDHRPLPRRVAAPGRGSPTTTQRYLHPDRRAVTDAGAALTAHLHPAAAKIDSPATPRGPEPVPKTPPGRHLRFVHRERQEAR